MQWRNTMDHGRQVPRGYKEMAQVSAESKYLANSRSTTAPSSISWKHIPPKNPEDVYFKGTKSKQLGRKKKDKAPTNVIFPVQSSEGQQVWKCERTHELFPHPSPVSQEELLELYTEEIQYLCVEDLTVHKKRIPRKLSSPRNLWKADDFPNMGNFCRNAKDESCLVADKKNTVVGPHSQQQRKASHIKEKEETFQHQEQLPVNQITTQISAYCQTEDRYLCLDLSSGSDGTSFRKLPYEVRGTVLNIISQNREKEEIISILSSLLYTFMAGTLQSATYFSHTSCRTSSYSASAEKVLLTPDDVESIKSQLSFGIKGLTSFPSKVNSNQNRCESIDSCFFSLSQKFPALRMLPGFSDVLPGGLGEASPW